MDGDMEKRMDGSIKELNIKFTQAADKGAFLVDMKCKLCGVGMHFFCKDSEAYNDCFMGYFNELLNHTCKPFDECNNCKARGIFDYYPGEKIEGGLRQAISLCMTCALKENRHETPF